jgi:RNA polymerase sigma-70 factor, ECF subfamily
MADLADRLYEQVLVLRCQTGDEAAFAELISRYHHRLHYFVRKLLAGAESTEDVLQDVWLDVFRGLPQLTEPGAFAAWLYRVARDRAFRLLRRRHQFRPAPLPPEELAEPEKETDFSPEDAGHIHVALDELSPEHREVLVLRFLEEMAYEDIARVTGCPVGTVRSRLHHAKRALRRILERGNRCERERSG